VRGAWAIARRELGSFFRVPLGWVTIALYLCLAGMVFAGDRAGLSPGAAATLRPLFSISAFLLLPVVPAISMRLLSEELRAGTIEPLLTSPVGDAAIIMGKYLGAAMFLAIMVAPTMLFGAVLFAISDPRPDPGPMLAGYLSLVLLGMLYLSVGMVISALTANQTLAFLGTFLLLLTYLLVTTNTGLLPPRLGTYAARASLAPRLVDFSKGIIDTSHVVFFLAGSAWFLSLAYVALQSRRWR
jgi:ABC-2 type transport system permease protein